MVIVAGDVSPRCHDGEPNPNQGLNMSPGSHQGAWLGRQLGVNVGRAPLPPGTLLMGHMAFMCVLAVTNLAWLVPILARLQFAASDWQTTLVTSSVPAFLMASIFWNDLLQRWTLRRYLMLLWLLSVFPLGCIGLAQDYWQMLACHVISCAGMAGWAPANGVLLKRFYPDAIRGRAYGILSMMQLAGGMGAAYFLGLWLDNHSGAFRIFFPAAAVTNLLGITLLLWLVRRARPRVRRLIDTARSWRALVTPLLNMGSILRADRRFLKYELAFMTYGAAFMFCEALLPVMATDRLGMHYEEFAHSTQFTRSLATLLLMMPMGWLMDRLGPMRTSAIAFAMLSLYPVLLAVATSVAGVTLASVVFGFGLAGVFMGWMLGPVTLAGSAGRVPQYVAIHATMVGVRGILFQGLSMGCYKLTGSFTVPFVAAALAFLWAAVQMWRLHGSIEPVGATRQPARRDSDQADAQPKARR
ncbi:MAG: MFS transporter [Phycisphaerae bacterium]|nr:MFS transporter [Phycisphaerae bacterium]